MRYRPLTFEEQCAVRFCEAMGRHDREIEQYTESLETLHALLEHVGAIRYDLDGSKSEYADRKAEIIDELDCVIDSAKASISNCGAVRIAAAQMFASDENASVCWLRYGKRLTWREVAKSTSLSVRSAQRRERAGLAYIFARMPREYKQVKRCDT